MTSRFFTAARLPRLVLALLFSMTALLTGLGTGAGSAFFTQSDQLVGDTVVVCLFDFCNEEPIQPVAHLPRFETLEAAKQVLEPQGGGTILLAPGAFRVTLEWSGNWTLKGLGIPEAVVFSPKEKPPLGSGFVEMLNDFGNFPQAAMFLVKENSTLRLENVTLQDDYLAPITSPDSPFADATDRLGFVGSYGLLLEENTSVSMNNVRILNWNSVAIGAPPHSRLSIENSEFVLPADLGTTIFTFKSKLMFKNNRMSYFSLVARESDLTFENNEFYKSTVFGHTKVSLKNNRFVDVATISHFSPGYGYDVGELINIFGNIDVIGNTFEVRDQALQDLIAGGTEAEALLVSSGPEDVIVVRDNTFRGYSTGVSLVFGTKLELENNLFEGNQVGFSVESLARLAQVFASNNRFLDHPRCAIEIEKRKDPENIVIDGLDNEFQGNAQDVCPADFPLPQGFSKR